MSISAGMFGKMVSALTDMDDTEYRHLIKVTNKFRKAQHSLIKAQEQLNDRNAARKSDSKGLKYELQ